MSDWSQLKEFADDKMNVGHKLKMCLENKKMLLARVFSVSLNVSEGFSVSYQKSGLCGKELKLAQMAKVILDKIENIMGKEKNAGY